jgi:hypothetical protein
MRILGHLTSRACSVICLIGIGVGSARGALFGKRQTAWRYTLINRPWSVFLFFGCYKTLLFIESQMGLTSVLGLDGFFNEIPLGCGYDTC